MFKWINRPYTEVSVGYFSNIIIRPLQKGDEIVGEAKEVPALPEELIFRWSISSPMDEITISEVLQLTNEVSRQKQWHSLDVETNGILNISKLFPRTRTSNTVLIRKSIEANASTVKELTFRYSDRVRIFLNGKRVYSGNASYQARDYRYLGIVGFHDSVGLGLIKGKNELIIAVSETFGGWAWTGVMEDDAGITLSD